MSATAAERVRALAAQVSEELRPGTTLLLRHSIREPIASAELVDAMAAPLTAEGRALAATLAAALPTSSSPRLHHSPVPRCEETARILADGLAARGAVVRGVAPLHALGASYVRDPDGLVERFAALGQRGFVRAWSRGELAPSLIEPVELAGRRLLAELRALAGEGLELHVSHDLTIIALLSLVEPIGDDAFPWPDYLDGVLLLPREDGGLRWRYGVASHETLDR